MWKMFDECSNGDLTPTPCVPLSHTDSQTRRWDLCAWNMWKLWTLSFLCRTFIVMSCMEASHDKTSTPLVYTTLACVYDSVHAHTGNEKCLSGIKAWNSKDLNCGNTSPYLYCSKQLDIKLKGTSVSLSVSHQLQRLISKIGVSRRTRCRWVLLTDSYFPGVGFMQLLNIGSSELLFFSIIFILLWKTGVPALLWM